MEDFAIDIFYFFKSGAKREDYREVQIALELHVQSFQRHVKCRWLTFIPVVDRLIVQFEGFKQFILVDLPKEDKQIHKNSRYLRLARKLKEKDFAVKMHFIVNVGPLFERFLKLFRKEGPMVHALYPGMTDVVKSVLLRFTRCSVIRDKSSRQLREIDLKDSRKCVMSLNVEIGESTSVAINRVTTSESEKELYISQMKAFYVAVLQYLLETLPSDCQLLKDMTCLGFDGREMSTSVEAIRRINRKLPCVISDVDSVNVIDEWKLYMLEEIPDEWKDIAENGIDHYWRKVFSIRHTSAQQKYTHLPKLVKACLVLSHGNADVERGFSANKRFLTSDRASLSVETLQGIRMIKEHLRVNTLKPHEVRMTPALLSAARAASSTYRARIARTLPPETNDPSTSGSSSTRSSESASDNDPHSLKMEEKRLEEAVRKAKAQLEAGQSVLAEAGCKLDAAITSRKFDDMRVAQAMLDTAQKDISTSTKLLEYL